MDLRRTSAWIALRLFWVSAVVAAAFALWARPAPACEIGGLGGSGLTLVALKVIS